ncbi:MAG: cyclic nucleotide-binding domain-containing protein [Thermodesulfovibrionales bacterium]|jgi:CRP/FNR family transcriptional regulator
MVSIEDLKKQALLEEMDEGSLEKISRMIQKVTYKKGHEVFREQEETKGLFLIHSGKLEIFKTTPDGWKQTLAVLGSGNFCGELSIFEKKSHTATALALEDVTVFLLSKADLEKIEEEDLALAYLLLKRLAVTLSRNLRRMNERFLNVLVNY